MAAAEDAKRPWDGRRQKIETRGDEVKMREECSVEGRLWVGSNSTAAK